MFISFWYSALPLSELHQHTIKQEVATEKCCEHDEETSNHADNSNSDQHNHGDHDCTPQCHCKCFSPHFYITEPFSENIIDEANVLLSAKPITFIQTDFSPGIFQPPKFI